jgi:TonB family protein
MGSKGTGRGSTGYGSGGGSYGKKKKGGIGKIGGQPIILGALDKSLIDAVIKRNMNQIRYCYQRELTKNPTIGGKIVIKFVIAKDGTVSKASVKSSSMGSPAVESCIAGRFRRFKFPEPKGGGIVIVSYPFIFSPG